MWSIFKSLDDLRLAVLAAKREFHDNTYATQVNTVWQQQHTHQLRLLNLKVEELLKRLRNLPDPGLLSISVTSEEENMLVFKIQLPAEPEGFTDIAKGELKVKIGDDAEQLIATEKGQKEVAGLKGAQGAPVSCSFVYIDDAGNRSEHPTELVGVALADTIPPPDAGALGIQVTAEEAD